jgi:hypothetical protein
MNLIKHGEVTVKSQSDFDNTKKAAYYDDEGFSVADSENKDKLKKPIKIAKEDKQHGIL